MRTLLVLATILLSGCASFTWEETPQQAVIPIEAPIMMGAHTEAPLAMAVPAGSWQAFRLVTDASFWAHNAGAAKTPIHVLSMSYEESEFSTVFGVRWSEDNIHWLPWAGRSASVTLLWSEEDLETRPQVEILVAVGSASADATAFISIGEEEQRPEPTFVASELNGTHAVGGTAFRISWGGQPLGGLAGRIQFDERWTGTATTDLGTVTAQRETTASASHDMADDAWMFMRLFNLDNVGQEAWSLALHADGGTRLYRGASPQPMDSGTGPVMPPHMDLAFETPSGLAGFDLQRRYTGWNENGPMGSSNAFFIVTWGRWDLDPSPLGWALAERLPSEDPSPARLVPTYLADF